MALHTASSSSATIVSFLNWQSCRCDTMWPKKKPVSLCIWMSMRILDNSQMFVYGNCDIDSARVECFIERQNATASPAEAECLQLVDLWLSVYRMTLGMRSPVPMTQHASGLPDVLSLWTMLKTAWNSSPNVRQWLMPFFWRSAFAFLYFTLFTTAVFIGAASTSSAVVKLLYTAFTDCCLVNDEICSIVSACVMMYGSLSAFLQGCAEHLPHAARSTQQRPDHSLRIIRQQQSRYLLPVLLVGSQCCRVPNSTTNNVLPIWIARRDAMLMPK